MERFQPKLGLGEGEEGEGGPIKFCKSDCGTESDGSVPILVAGEEAGLDSRTDAGRGSATRAWASFAPGGFATCVTGRCTGRKAK